MEYDILEAETIPELKTRVQAYLQEGWRPLGGIATTAVWMTYDNSRSGHFEQRIVQAYVQAMTR